MTLPTIIASQPLTPAEVIGLLLVAWGLWQMQRASKRRNDQMDRMEEQSQAQIDALKSSTRSLEKLLEKLG